jgi:hypothetical protein
MATVVRRRIPVVAVVVLALLIGWQTGGQRAAATHQPANKVSAAGSTTDVMEPGKSLPILTGTLRTATPEDLVFAVTAECSIVTNITTVGNDEQRAFGQVRFWVTVDGTAVPVSGSTDDGKVVFCNRAYARTTSLFDDQDATIATYLKTREANAFNWLALNVGSGIHTITVWAEFTTEATDKAVAEAVVGKRTMIVDPTKLANDASI